jgi:hypothetical protein
MHTLTASRAARTLGRNRLQAAVAEVPALLYFWLVHRLWGQYSTAPGYNRNVRLIFPLLVIFCLAGCQHGGANNTDAVRQGVIDHLAQAKFDMAAMDIKVNAVKFNGEQADADVAITLKGKSDAPAMNFRYHLEHQATKWVVVGMAQDSGHSGGAGTAAPNAGTNPHGGAMPPAAAGSDNPHGAMPPAGGGSGMPSPQDLPPAKK